MTGLRLFFCSGAQRGTFVDELWPGKIRKKEFFGSVEILSFIILFKKAMRVTPSLPQRGRQPKGNIPLTPFLHLSHFKKEFSSTSKGLSYFLWMPYKGGGKGSRSPKENRYNFPMISTKPIFHIIFFQTICCKKNLQPVQDLPGY